MQTQTDTLKILFRPLLFLGDCSVSGWILSSRCLKELRQNYINQSGGLTMHDGHPSKTNKKKTKKKNKKNPENKMVPTSPKLYS